MKSSGTFQVLFSKYFSHLTYIHFFLPENFCSELLVCSNLTPIGPVGVMVSTQTTYKSECLEVDSIH